MISFIVHYRQDTIERKKNYQLVYKFYKEQFPGCQFVFVEEAKEPTLQDLQEGDSYVLLKNDGPHRKCLGYNLGFQCVKFDNLCFLDIDIVVDPKHITTAVETVNRTPGICVAYNGTALYLNYKGKAQLADGITMEKMQALLPAHWHSLVPLTNYPFFQLAGVHSVGGCVVTTRQAFRKYNGFNPFFVGWGYEDNEIVTRVHRLGYMVNKINTPDAYLFHLPHEIVAKDKSQHNHYSNNHQIVTKVESMNKEQLEEYIKTW